LVCRMLFGGFMKIGFGILFENIPIAIGMRMAGCGPTFFAEMFGAQTGDPDEFEKKY